MCGALAQLSILDPPDTDGVMCHIFHLVLERASRLWGASAPVDEGGSTGDRLGTELWMSGVVVQGEGH